MNDADSIDECMICLESILKIQKVGKIPCCPSKLYHDQCILQWSRTSNSCPTCRNRFHKIELTDNHQNTIEIISIQDRLLPNPAINDIPLQFIIRQQPPTNPVLEEEEEDDYINGATCHMCSNNTLRNGISCQQYGCHFHLNCLGVQTLEESICWYCPICDYNQESVVPQRSKRGMQNSIRFLNIDNHGNTTTTTTTRRRRRSRAEP